MAENKKPNNLASALSEDEKPITNEITPENANEITPENANENNSKSNENNNMENNNETKDVKQIAVQDDKGLLKPNNKTKKSNLKPNTSGNKTLKRGFNNLSTESSTNNNIPSTEAKESAPSNIPSGDMVEAPVETRPNNENKDKEKKTSLNRLAMNLLNHQVVLKLFHFQTEHYGAHKASDSYLEKFAGTMDKFLEIAQGIYGKITLKKYGLTGSSHTDENIVKHLDGMLTYLREKIDDVLGEYTDLINVRDELAGDIEQLKYLLTFK